MIELPAAASICAFAMAVVSWYGMLRTGMQLLNSDVQAAKSFDREIDLLQEKLLGQKRALETWKVTWLLSDDAPESMFLDFWGEAEYQGIQKRLKNMVKSCNSAEKKLGKFMTLEEEKWQAMGKLRKRVFFIGVKSDHLRKLLEVIAADVDAIDTAARNGWRRGDLIPQERIDFGKVYHTGAGHLLVSVAMQIKDDADALHLSCRSAQECARIEMDLDIFDYADSMLSAQSTAIGSAKDVSRASHTAGIAKAAKDDLLPWRVRGQNSTLGEMNSVRMQVQRVQKPSNGCLIPPLAFMRIMQGHADRTHFTSEGICFTIAMAHESTHWSPEPCKTLRHLFCDNRPPTFTNEDLLGRISKFRAAFELAQACLLLIRTSWFPHICSCQIRCTRCSPASTEITYYFGLQMGSVDHEAPSWASEVLDSCWGAAGYNWNFLTTPLRRTGLLLVEIVIGAPILRITNGTSGIVESITFVEGFPSQLTERSENLEDVLRHIRKAFSQRKTAEDAVRYCLSTYFPEAPTDNEMKGLLAEFYINVVEPLKDHYDERLDAYLKRTRQREFIRRDANRQ